MNLPRPDIFISAASRDLKAARGVIERALLDLGAHPVVQEHLAPAGQTVAGMLREKIAASHAVIHLVGRCYGFEDETLPAARAHHTYAQGRRSYTQLEHDLALDLGKPLYLFLCAEDYPYAPHEPEPEELQQLQRAHHSRLLPGNHLYYLVKSPAELREQVLRLEEVQKIIAEEVQRLKEERERAEREMRQTHSFLRRHAVLLSISAVLLCLAGWGINHQLLKNNERQEAIASDLAALRVELRGAAPTTGQILDENGQGILSEDGRPIVAEGKAGGDLLAERRAKVAAERGISIEDLRKELTREGKDIASIVAQIEEREKAMAHEKQALTELKRDAITKLGDTALANSNYGEAVQHYRAAAALYDRTLKPLLWADAQAKLAEALQRRGQYAEAAAIWKELIKERKRHLHTDDRSILMAEKKLAVCKWGQTFDIEGEQQYRSYLRVSEEVFGPDHLATIMSLNALAGFLRTKGDHVEVEALYRRALETSDRRFGAEHLATCLSAYNLALFLVERNRKPEAVPLAWQAYRGLRKSKGADYKDTRNARKLLLDLGETVSEESEANGK